MQSSNIDATSCPVLYGTAVSMVRSRMELDIMTVWYVARTNMASMLARAARKVSLEGRVPSSCWNDSFMEKIIFGKKKILQMCRVYL